MLGDKHGTETAAYVTKDKCKIQHRNSPSSHPILDATWAATISVVYLRLVKGDRVGCLLLQLLLFQEIYF